MLENFTALSWQQVVLAAVLALIVWSILRKFLFGKQNKNGGKTWGEVEMAKVMTRCFEMFPIDTISFQEKEFKRGMKIRVVTENEVIDGELVGMNQIKMICICTHTKIVATPLHKIKEMIQQ